MGLLPITLIGLIFSFPQNWPKTTLDYSYIQIKCAAYDPSLLII